MTERHADLLHNEATTSRVHSSHDVAIIGAGPIGLELAVCLKRAGLDYIHFDAHQIGYTMTWWPHNTYFFSTTERLAIAGVPIQNNHQQRITGEDYLAYLRAIVEQFDLAINTYEPVAALARTPEGFTLTTQPLAGERHYHCRRIVLAIGDMHRPNYLQIPGEDLPHVSHYFRDPHDYFRKRLLIIGGRNSAVEAALRCWRAGAQVTLSYRRAQFDEQTVKHWVLPDIQAQIEAGTIGFLPATLPVEITPTHVALLPATPEQPDNTPILHETDFVLINSGFRGEQDLLEMAGVTLRGENRTPLFNPETMETNVPGLYLVGTVVAGIQQRYSLFIENSHEHAGKVTAALTGHWPTQLGSVASRNYDLRLEQIKTN
ncbi:MAG: NAD(P)-binding domain-containing protein [Chloroflexi bacterium]|nr:NAD(P)-binding domain-containing protein [Chloroflexota bacterium]